jgi:putative acetyltransferase
LANPVSDIADVAMILDIRPSSPDHPQVQAMIAELDAHLLSVYPPEEAYRLDVAGLMQPSVTFLGAWMADTLVGCGGVRTMPGEAATDGQAYGEIKRMFVSPGHRRARIGARILAELESRLQAQGIARALLETGEDLVQAARMYRAAGYVQRAEFGEYPDNGSSLFLEKRWKTD